MRNHWAIIFYYIIIRLILIIFFKALYISQKPTKFGSQNFSYQIWFCTRLLHSGWVSGEKSGWQMLSCASASVGLAIAASLFSAANLTLAGFPLTNALGESMPSRHLNMFNLCLCNAAIIRYSRLKFGLMHLCGMDYKYFSPHCCKCNCFGCTAAKRCDNACHEPHSHSLYSGSKHCQFNSPRLVKREAGFPNPRRALIGSNQLWRINDSVYYRE